MDNIVTERLIIRKFRKKDAQDLLEYLSNPLVDCFVPERLTTLEQAKREAVKRQRSGKFLAVELKDSGKVIGNIYFGKGAFDCYDIGWNFNVNYCGKGYAYESAHAVMDYAFNTLEVRKIEAHTADTNERSYALMERLGMRREGHYLDKISFVNNPDGTPKWESSYSYAILQKEWSKK